jgi:hypothetical protein
LASLLGPGLADWGIVLIGRCLRASGDSIENRSFRGQTIELRGDDVAVGCSFSWPNPVSQIHSVVAEQHPPSGALAEKLSVFEGLSNPWYGAALVAAPGHRDESEIDS